MVRSTIPLFSYARSWDLPGVSSWAIQVCSKPWRKVIVGAGFPPKSRVYNGYLHHRTSSYYLTAEGWSRFEAPFINKSPWPPRPEYGRWNDRGVGGENSSVLLGISETSKILSPVSREVGKMGQKVRTASCIQNNSFIPPQSGPDHSTIGSHITDANWKGYRLREQPQCWASLQIWWGFMTDPQHVKSRILSENTCLLRQSGLEGLYWLVKCTLFFRPRLRPFGHFRKWSLKLGPPGPETRGKRRFCFLYGRGGVSPEWPIAPQLIPIAGAPVFKSWGLVELAAGLGPPLPEFSGFARNGKKRGRGQRTVNKRFRRKTTEKSSIPGVKVDFRSLRKSRKGKGGGNIPTAKSEKRNPGRRVAGRSPVPTKPGLLTQANRRPVKIGCQRCCW